MDQVTEAGFAVRQYISQKLTEFVKCSTGGNPGVCIIQAELLGCHGQPGPAKPSELPAKAVRAQLRISLASESSMEE